MGWQAGGSCSEVQPQPGPVLAGVRPAALLFEILPTELGGNKRYSQALELAFPSH